MSPGDAVHIDAPAKINLFLKVLRRRDDGYHELDTLFQAVDLCDEVTVARAGAGVALRVEGADVGPERDNLAYRAAAAFLEAAGVGGGLEVLLTKRIPAGAGLGGGSSDAAAVLRAANAVLGGPLEAATLHALAAGLGSDVPFFLGPGTLARGTGRGEVLEMLPPLPELPVVLVLPPVHVSTAEAYGRLARARAEGGGTSVSIEGAADPGAAASTSPSVAALPAGWADVARDAVNDFEDVVPEGWPEVGRALAALRRSGAVFSLLSGSGGACFGVFGDAGAARSAAAALEDQLGCQVVTTRTRVGFPRPDTRR